MITDLDNTLYDWVAWYARALQAMAERAARAVGCPVQQMYDELRDAYTQRGSVEEPRALLDLPTVLARFGDRTAAARALEPALDAFTRAPAHGLHAYPGVLDGLARLAARGTTVVAHTEATAANAVRRLRHLHLESSLAGLFAGASRHGRAEGDPLPEAIAPAPPFGVWQLGPERSKPDPATVREICARMHARPAHVLYIGDNLERDIAMARGAGVWTAWARFGVEHDPRDWARLVSITHWTQAEVTRAERSSPTGARCPHVTLEHSFAEIFQWFAFEPPAHDAETSAESA